LFGGLLELIAPVYNINMGFNEEMLKKSETLSGYSFFVDLARQHTAAGCELEEATRRAVEGCIEKGILADFLRDHSSEVINMLTAEFKLEDALQVWKEEGFEEGIEKGIQKGIAEGIEKGIAEGIEKGIEEGIQKGIAREQEIARNLLANGVSVEIVAKSTGLSPDKVRALANG
jgi:predicted transposase YdaD